MPREIVISTEGVVASEDGKSYKVQVPDEHFVGTITEEDLRTKYVPVGTHSKLQTEVETRISSAVDTARGGFRTEAINDDDFLGEAIKERKDYFADRFPKEGEGPDPEQLFEKWTGEHITPLNERVTTLTEENENLKSEAVQGAISRGQHDAGVDDEHMSLMDDHLLRRVAWSEEHHRVVIIDPTKASDSPDRLVTVLNKENELVPETVSGYLVKLRESGKWDFAFRSDVRTGGDFDGGKGKIPGETLQQQIARLEGEGKFAEAAPLKEKLLRQAEKAPPTT